MAPSCPALARRAVAAGGFVYVTCGRHEERMYLAFDDDDDCRVKALALFLCATVEHLNSQSRSTDTDDDEEEEPAGLWDALDALESLIETMPTALEPMVVTATTAALAASRGSVLQRSCSIATGSGERVNILVTGVEARAAPPAPAPALSGQSAALTTVGCW